MYSVLKSYGLNGLNGFAVAVEADVSGGLPAFSLVGPFVAQILHGRADTVAAFPHGGIRQAHQ